MKRAYVVVMVLLGLLTTNLFGQKPAVVISNEPGWHKIGETTADFSREKDEVAVIGANRFASLKFRVTDAPIEISDVTVTFSDGTTKNIKVGMPLKQAGDSSREIDLPGSEANVTKITFTYKTVGNSTNKKAHVEIWGMKTNADKDSKKSDWK